MTVHTEVVPATFGSNSSAGQVARDLGRRETLGVKTLQVIWCLKPTSSLPVLQTPILCYEMSWIEH